MFSSQSYRKSIMSLYFLLVFIVVCFYSVSSVLADITLEDIKSEMNTLKEENLNLRQEFRRMNKKWQDEISVLKYNLMELDEINRKLRASQEDSDNSLINRIHGLEDNFKNVFMNIKSFQNNSGNTKPQLADIFHDNINQEVKRLHTPYGTTTGPNILRVAFCAIVKEKIHDVGFNQILLFEKVITDTHNSFHGKSGIFTAPRSGNYVFFVSLLCYPNKYLEYLIVKDGKADVMGHCENQGGWGSTTTPVIFYVEQGEKVWVRIDGNDHSPGDLIYPTFSLFGGFIL